MKNRSNGAPCPHRERETLVKQRTSTVNRMKSILIQFGVRNFNPVLRKAP
jgi:transposase